MTAQDPEILHYRGKKLKMFTNPLSDFFAMGGFNPHFRSYCTGLWRGYIGTWEIIDKRLYLRKIEDPIMDSAWVSIEKIFPGFPERVFAHWFSGTIRIPRGRVLDYGHMGYGLTYERDWLIEIERGIVKGEQIRHNGTTRFLGLKKALGLSP